MRTIAFLFMQPLALLFAVVAVDPAIPAPPPLEYKAGDKGDKPPEKRYTPFDAVVLAAADIQAVAQLADPAVNPHDIAYLSLHNIPQAERKRHKAAVDFVLNSLNTKFRKIVRTASLPSSEDDPVVLRVNLADYGIDKAAWENLAAKGSGSVPLPEPYFYARTEKVTDVFKTETYKARERKQTGVYANTGQPYYEEREVEKTRQVKTGAKKEVTLTTAPWVALEPENPGSTIASLLQTTQNKFPILRADWFVTYATWAPAYYELIGLKLKPNPDKEAAKKVPLVFLETDFGKLFEFDAETAGKDAVAAITDTKIVTLHNRIVQRFSTVTGVNGGYYWRSQDTDLGIDDEDYLNQIANFDRPKIKAQEIIASGRNGLNFYALTDNKGIVLNVAVATIAIQGDSMPTRLQDKQVFAGRNCMFCHAGGQLPLRDKVRNIARGKIALFIADKTKDQAVARKIEDAFSPDTKSLIDFDNARFLASVKAASGLDGKDVSGAVEGIIYEYFDKTINLEKMSWESGWERDKLEAALKRGINLDYTLTAVLQEPAEDVSRLPWERQGFAALMQFLLGQPK